jgi:peroxiredoxin
MNLFTHNEARTSTSRWKRPVSSKAYAMLAGVLLLALPLPVMKPHLFDRALADHHDKHQEERAIEKPKQAIGKLGELLPGYPAPDFSLPAADGTTKKLSDYAGKTVVLEWFNSGCPYVQKHYASGNMQKLQREYTAKGIVWLGIVSSAPGKQGHLTAEELQLKIASLKSAHTAMLIDETGEVGKLYGAKTTPHMFIVKQDGTLAYEGAIDDKRGTDIAEIVDAKNYVRQALDELAEGKKVSTPKTTSYGCSVKYS